MNTTKRVTLGASSILILLVILLARHLLDLGNQYGAFLYLRTSLFHAAPSDLPAAGINVEDKVVIMAKMETEGTDWLATELPSWQRAIYTVNPSTPLNDTLSTPRNKGREAMAYLTYIIDNYAALPATMAFIHPHRSGFLDAWHTDTPLHSNVDALTSLRVSFVQDKGYANLRCNWNPGCRKKHRKNEHVTSKIWQEIFGHGDAPSEVGAACCPQFAVSRSRVLERPLRDYEHFRQWILDTDLTDAKSGRVFEFLWHVIFGMDPV